MASLSLLVVAILLASAGMAQDADPTGPTTIIGPRNPDLYEGAEKLLSGRAEEGVQLTLRGLQFAQGKREEEAALANLCAGYVMLEDYDEALRYCDTLLSRNDENWRGYNNRALIYIHTGQYEKAHQDLLRGEEINPGARTLKLARSIYLDAVDPVAPEIEIDDRPAGERDSSGDDEQP